MNISIGIVGLPNVGKSTLFNAVTKKEVPMENFPFCTIDPSVGVVSVPDKRLDALAKLSSSEKVIPAVIEIVDIAGLVRGASKGEGLGNAFLSHIREVDAVAHIVRCFLNEDISHVEGTIDPKRDIEIIETELLLADLQIVEKRLERVEKDISRGEKGAPEEKKLLEHSLVALREGRMLLSCGYSLEEKKILNGLGLLTQKPVMYICNIGDQYDEAAVQAVRDCASRIGADVVCVYVHTEMELSKLSTDEAHTMRKELVQDENGIDLVVQSAYNTLHLISFFTTGEKETRAWTVTKGSTAPIAGSAIHSDFEQKFIRAEVISYDNLVKEGSFMHAREHGVLHLEGKEYVVQDGDVITFRHG